MKFSALLVLLPILAVATPVPVPAPEAKPEALNILGIDLPLDLPGLNLPLLGGGAGGSKGSGTANPGAGGTAVPIPVDEISKLLTPILENLGAPHEAVQSVINLVNGLVANNGVLPLGVDLNPVTGILPKLLSGEALDTVGTGLNQILQSVLPGKPTSDLVGTVIDALKNITQIRTNPTAPGITGTAKPTAAPGVVPGLQTILGGVLGSINGFNPAGKSVPQVAKQLSVITDTVNSATKAVSAGGGKGVSPDIVADLLKQIITALNQLLGGISKPDQLLLAPQGLPLVKSVGGLLRGIGSVPGLNGTLQGLLGNLLGGLAPGSGSLGGLLARVLNGVFGLLNGGNLGGGLGGLLGGLGGKL